MTDTDPGPLPRDDRAGLTMTEVQVLGVTALETAARAAEAGNVAESQTFALVSIAASVYALARK